MDGTLRGFIDDAAGLKGDARYRTLRVAADYMDGRDDPMAYTLRLLAKYRKFPAVRIMTRRIKSRAASLGAIAAVRRSTVKRSGTTNGRRINHPDP